MPIRTKLVISESTNPWFNLAYEEQLVNTVKPDEVVLYLWQNAHTVVIGKHQNPWREVLVKALEGDQGKLARRLSGGGAVYHDLGNLNFTFAMNRQHEDLERQLSVLLKAVKALGIEASFSGRNDILAGDRKFSGNAFYNGKENYYHHGTLLVDVNMEHLGKYLNASVKKLSAKGVKSVKSRVVNLKSINPEITIDGLKAVLESAFSEIYGVPESKIFINEENITGTALDRYHHYASWEWRFGKTPAFDATFDERFEWGEFILNIQSKQGVINHAEVNSDAMSTAFIDAFEGIFDGIPFKREAILEAARRVEVAEDLTTMKQNVLDWLETLPI
ncbi:lipoate--protein ligase [Fusibacter paucivorans]|uniref:lipoate--protein ligase n=1 Tax=Fusibacter paucivorans TaxID=76009 RepID=A0ABS5PJ64_9FIRM|nr:lipoate--protein ligase [Fusibacter paucivorans]MBS7525058.1 lipoate--protein ligase [Fusibacter paucivorans]